MIKTVSLASLQAGEQIGVSPGDTLEVLVSFNYLTTVPVAAELWLSLVIPPGRDYTVKQVEQLGVASDVTEWSGSIRMPIEASGIFGFLKNYTYDLYFEIPYATSEVAIAQDAVVVTGVVAGIVEMIPNLILVMMMSVMMSVMGE